MLVDVTDELEDVINQAFDIVNDVITSVRAVRRLTYVLKCTMFIDIQIPCSVCMYNNYIAQFLDESQVKDECPALEDGSVFSDLDLDFVKILSNTSGQIPDVGYIQECIINQGFDFLQQFDVYRYR